MSQFYQQSKVFPFSYSIYCADQDGNVLSGGRDESLSKTLYFWAVNSSTGQHVYQYAIDDRGNRGRFLRDLGFFDPRTRPWYQGALQRQQPYWTEVYADFISSLPIITASQPILADNGQIIGVCAVDVLLPEEFRSFLANLSIGKNGKAFIIDRSGQIISSSTEERLTIGKGDDAKLIHASQSSEPIVRTTARFLQQKFGNFEQIQQSQQLDFSIEGQRQFVQVSPFRDGKGLNWLIVITVPQSDFMAQINANTRSTILLTLAALIVAIVLGILTAHWITRPILRVSQAAEAISSGDLEQQVASSHISHIVELERLTRSFNRMAGQLKASFANLQQSEAQNQAILAALPDFLFRATEDGICLDDAIGRDRLKAVSSGERSLAGVSIYDTLPAELAHQRVQAIQQALRTGELQIHEHQLTIDGQVLDEEVRIAKVNESEVLIMVRDISDRKRAEAALRIAEENYRSIFENALEGIFQSTPEGYFIAVNPATARIYGYSSPEEMLAGKTAIGRETFVDLAKRREFERLLNEQGHVKDFEYQIYRKDGSIIWIEENTRAVQGAQENVLYYEGIIQNITDRKHQKEILEARVEERTLELTKVNAALKASEAELRGLFAAMDDVIIVYNREGTCLKVASTHPNRLLKSSEEMIGRSIHDILPAAQANQRLETIHQVLETHQTITLEYSLLFGDEATGKEVWFSANFSPLSNDDVMMVARDISERKQAEAALQNSLTQLAIANQEIKLLNQRLESENIRLNAELSVARQLQQMILPKDHEFDLIDDLEIAGFMQPADEVGGDYYDVIPHNGSVKIGIGDVTGHGLESGVLMIMVQTAVRTLLANNETDPSRFLNTINQVIYDNAQRMNSHKNLTLALLDYQAGRVKLSGQHEEVLVVRADGQIERIDTTDLGFLLGLLPSIGEFVAQTEVQLQSGDGMILYTDGITEAENEAQEYYGLERLCRVATQHWEQSAAAIQQAIVADVRVHIGKQKVYDDMTLLVLKQK